jgi:hypothetical protein
MALLTATALTAAIRPDPPGVTVTHQPAEQQQPPPESATEQATGAAAVAAIATLLASEHPVSSCSRAYATRSSNRSPRRRPGPATSPPATPFRPASSDPRGARTAPTTAGGVPSLDISVLRVLDEDSWAVCDDLSLSQDRQKPLLIAESDNGRRAGTESDGERSERCVSGLPVDL